MLVLASVLSLVGCTYFAPFDLRSTDPGDTDAAAEADVPRDAEREADHESSLDSDLDLTGIMDSDIDSDADPDTDHDPDLDDDPTLAPCALPYEGELLALYAFNRDFLDSIGDHDGILVDTEGCLDYPAHGDGCGQSLAFRRGCSSASVRIEDSDEWNRVRSIDFWFRSLHDDLSGILSRDAAGVGPGDLAVLRFGNGRIALRVQLPLGAPEEWEGRSTIICSFASVTDADWVHVGINVGGGEPSELWLDGRQQEGSGAVDDSWDVVCGDNANDIHDLTGNENPWVIGAATWLSPRGEGVPQAHLHHARVDHLRFTDTRQVFSTYFDH